jgi:hypothetical protein
MAKHRKRSAFDLFLDALSHPVRFLSALRRADQLIGPVRPSR